MYCTGPIRPIGSRSDPLAKPEGGGVMRQCILLQVSVLCVVSQQRWRGYVAELFLSLSYFLGLYLRAWSLCVSVYPMS